jgi:glucose-6-phosphate 1-dehydrogenase
MFDEKVKIQNHMIIIFGANNNHIKKNLIPALYQLYEKGHITQTTPILCVGKEKMTKSSYIDLIEAEKNLSYANTNILSGFLQLINYVKHDIQTKDTTSLISSVSRLDKINNCKGNKILYFLEINEELPQLIENIKKSKIIEGKGFTRIAYENHFIDNFEKTKQTNKLFLELVKEEDIFRITNTPEKNCIENLIYLKNSNYLIEKILTGENIDNVQITIYDKNNTENFDFYDEFGEINHTVFSYALDLINYIIIEPKDTTEKTIKKEIVKQLKTISKCNANDVIFGQYGSGKINEQKTQGYKKQENISKDSNTETFVSLKLKTIQKNWKNTQFYIKSGKAMNEDLIKIDFVLKESKNNLLKKLNLKQKNNVISFNIFPKFSLSINLNYINNTDNKKDSQIILKTNEEINNYINFYENIIYDIMIADKIRFKTIEELQLLSNFSSNLKKILTTKKQKFPNYNAGDKPPKELDLFIKKDKKEWI